MRFTARDPLLPMPLRFGGRTRVSPPPHFAAREKVPIGEPEPSGPTYVSVSYGRTNNMPGGDGLNSCMSNDNVIYLSSNDDRGPDVTNHPFPFDSGVNCAFRKIVGDPRHPVFGVPVVNPMPEFGPFMNVGPDGDTYKTNGIISVGGKLYLHACREELDPGIDPSNWARRNSQIMVSSDHGDNWYPWPPPLDWGKSPRQSQPFPNPQFPGQPMGAMTFVIYGPDNTGAVDGGDQYVYAVDNGGWWIHGDWMKLGRCPIEHLDKVDNNQYWQYYQGGDGMQSSSWNNNYSTAYHIIDNPYKCASWGQVKYLPVYKGGVYLWISCYYPSFQMPNPPAPTWSESVWEFWEAPKPWGPWTLVHTGPTFNQAAVSVEGGLTPTTYGQGTYGICIIPGTELVTPNKVTAITSCTGDWSGGGSDDTYTMHLHAIELSTSPIATQPPPVGMNGGGPPPPTIAITTQQTDIPNVYVGVNWSFTFQASGGTSPYTWSVDWTEDVSFNTSTGTLTWVNPDPNAIGIWPITVNVSDASSPPQHALPQTFNITVTGGGGGGPEPPFNPNHPGSYDIFYGPFSSWINVLSPPQVVQDYLTAHSLPPVNNTGVDCIDSLQAIADFCGIHRSLKQWYYNAGYNWVNVNDSGTPTGHWQGGQYTRDQLYAMAPNFGPPQTDPHNDPGLRNYGPGFPKSGGTAAGWNGPVGCVLYLPAGTYGISKTLKFYDRQGLTIVGEHPATTTLKWLGDDFPNTYPGYVNWALGNWVIVDHNLMQFDMMVLDGSMSGNDGAVKRLNFDGQGKARCGINYVFTENRGGGGGELADFQDLWFKNMTVGMSYGFGGGANDADNPVKRCRFEDIRTTGVFVTHQNVLNINHFDCLFRNCDSGIFSMYGATYVAYNCLFINSRIADVFHPNSANTRPPLRGNTSIVTHDHTHAPAFFSGPWSRTAQGNLIINARVGSAYGNTNGWAWKPKNGDASNGIWIDNALYTADYLNGTNPGNPITWQYWMFTGYPDNIGQKDGAYSSTLFSGNTYNGYPLPAGSASITVDSNPAFAIPGYAPPNHFELDNATITQLLQVGKDDPLIQTIIDMMPQCPPRVDPYSSDIRLVELQGQSTSTVDATLQAFVNQRDPGKINMLHFPYSQVSIPGFAWGSGYQPNSALVLPSGYQWVLIGDGKTTKLHNYNYSLPGPFITVGDGGPVKVWIEGLQIADGISWGTTSTLQIRSQDVPGDRVYIYHMPGAQHWDPRGGALKVTGFQHLRARVDFFMSSEVECEGVGNIIQSNDDVVLRVYGLNTLSRVQDGTGARRSCFYVRNGGSLHVYDMYNENIFGGIDLRGCKGYLVHDDTQKWDTHVNAIYENIDAGIAHLENFEGHQFHLFWTSMRAPIYRISVPPPGSSITMALIQPTYYDGIPWIFEQLWGSTALAVDPQLFAMTGMPNYWTQSSMLDGSSFFGLSTTEGANAQPNLNIGQNEYQLQFWNWLNTLPTPLPDAAGYVGGQVGNKLRPFPTGANPNDFQLSALAWDALRYRRFPLPKKIDDPNLSDIVIQNVSFISPRPFSLEIIKI